MKKPTKKQLALRKKWVKALRSGKYGQCRNALYDNGRYCCLGVACEVLKIGHRDWRTDTNLSKRGAEALGLPMNYEGSGSCDGRLPDGTLLTTLNDEVGLTFSEIAKRIEIDLIKPFED